MCGAAGMSQQVVKKRVFVCYNQRDRVLVDQLARTINDPDYDIWWDLQLQGGHQWMEETQDRLELADVVLFCVGPNGCGKTQTQEVFIANNRKNNTGEPLIIPVLLPGGGPVWGTVPPFVGLLHRISYDRSIEDEVEVTKELRCVIKDQKYRRSVSQPSADVAPYVGLESFDEHTEKLFQGRESEIDKVFDLIRGVTRPEAATHRVIGVVGASGSGKSSLIRAGVIPRLRKGLAPGIGKTAVVKFRPSEYAVDPRQSLAIAMSRDLQMIAPDGWDYPDILARLNDGQDGLRLVLNRFLTSEKNLSQATCKFSRILFFIDQFEELYSICDSKETRDSFLESLLRATLAPEGPAILLFTLRVDQYHLCLNNRDIAQAVSSQQLLLGPISPNGLRDVICLPARQANCEIESHLIETLIADVQGKQNALPLLQYALLELWNRRIDNRMTSAAYRQMGGIVGALNDSADTMFKSLTVPQQEICEKVMTELIKVDGNVNLRDRRTQEDLEAVIGTTADAKTVMNSLHRYRLIAGDNESLEDSGYVEITHESLIDGWDLLKEWTKKRRDHLQFRSRIREDAKKWAKERKKPEARDLLYRGKRLRNVMEWYKTTKVSLTPTDQAFISASLGQRRFSRLMLSIVSVLAVSTTLVAFYLVVSKNRRDTSVNNALLSASNILNLKGLRALDSRYNDDVFERLDQLIRQTGEVEVAGTSKDVLPMHIARLMIGSTVPNRESQLAESRSRLTSSIVELSADDLQEISELIPEQIGEIVPDLWQMTEIESSDASVGSLRLKALCLLAQADSSDERWVTKADGLLEDLRSETNLEDLAIWLKMAKPIYPILKSSIEREIVKLSTSLQVDSQVLDLIADRIVEDSPVDRAKILLSSSPRTFNRLFRPSILDDPDVIDLCKNQLKTASAKAEESQVEQTPSVRHRVNAAIMLIKLGKGSSEIWDLLSAEADNSARTEFIHRLHELQVDRAVLDSEWTKQIGNTDKSRLSALLMALGSYSYSSVQDGSTSFDIVSQIEKLYEFESDSGLHSAFEWLFKRWGISGRLVATQKSIAGNYRSKSIAERSEFLRNREGWFIDGLDQQFCIIEKPGEVLIGASQQEQLANLGGGVGRENRHHINITRRYAIGQTEVSAGVYQKFLDSLNPMEKIELARRFLGESELQFRFGKTMNDEQLVAKCFDIDHKYSPTSKHPANGLIWYVAARFCNWMSAQEGLDESQWCYGPNELIGPGMKLSPDCLSRFGYRMPTEAEWEYAARSGTLNSRYFGDAMEFSNQFALFNSGLGDTPIALMESGVLKPNDFGLFDVLGNCDEWTQSHFYSWRDFAESDHFEDTVGLESVGGDDDQRVARGGSLVARPVYTRASNRYPIHPNISSSQNRNCIGLRLARTLPPRN